MLDDPCTGRSVPFVTSDAAEVLVDRVDRLAAASAQGRPNDPPTSGRTFADDLAVTPAEPDAPQSLLVRLLRSASGLPGWSAPPPGVVPGAA